MNAEKRNVIKYYLVMVYWYLMILVITGGMLQTFLLEYGISENNVSIYASVLQIMQMLVYVVLSPKVEQVKNVIWFTGCCFIFCLPMLIIHMLIPHMHMPVTFGMVLLYIGGIVCSLCQGIYGIMGCKVVYFIMNMKNFTRISSVAIIIGSVVSSLASVLLSYLQKKYDYFSVMFWVYLVLAFATIGAILLSVRMKKIADPEKKSDDKKGKISLWKYEPFRKLAVANVLRGINNGFINIAVTIGYYLEILDKETAGTLVIITNVMLIAGNYIVAKTADKKGEGWQILVFSILIAVTCPLMIVGKNATMFILFYGIAYLGIAVICTAVPAAVAKIVDYEVAAQYAGWRMMLFTLGMAIPGFVCVTMLEIFGGFVTMLVAGVAQLTSGIMYYRYYNKRMQNVE